MRRRSHAGGDVANQPLEQVHIRERHRRLRRRLAAAQPEGDAVPAVGVGGLAHQLEGRVAARGGRGAPALPGGEQAELGERGPRGAQRSLESNRVLLFSVFWFSKRPPARHPEAARPPTDREIKTGRPEKGPVLSSSETSVHLSSACMASARRDSEIVQIE